MTRSWPVKPALMAMPFRAKRQPDGPAVRIPEAQAGAMTEALRARLEAFYTDVNPAKVGEIDKLLDRYAGKEQELLQAMHRKYGVRDLASDVAVDEVYENERYSFLTMGFGSSFPGHLTLLDRKRYSMSHGSPSSQVFETVEPPLPKSADDDYEWAWTGPWEIDANYVPCDRDGWTYAFDFSNFSPMLLKDEGRATPGMTDYVRRRRWMRTRVKVPVQRPIAEDEQPVAEPLLSPIDAAESGLLAEKDSSLQFYSRHIDLASYKDAWSHQVHKLQKLHARLEHIIAGRKLMWKRSKVELKAQSKSALAMIAALKAAIAADEKRGVKTVVKQTQLDVYMAHYEDLKRRIWFPEAKGYLLRASLIGLYVGVKDLWVDTVRLHFSADVAVQPNKTVRCHIRFSGHIVIRLHGVKLKAEKGTRVPNSRWSSMHLSTQAIGDLELVYNPADGHWSSSGSKGIELHKMSLKVTGNAPCVARADDGLGGLDLPDGVFKMLLTEVANTLVQDVFLVHFPPELGHLFEHPTSLFQVQGELHLDGPGIADVVDATLEAVNDRDESKMPLQAFDEVAALLGLNRAQLNLLVALRGFLLCPQPHSLQSLRALATYFRTYWLPPHAMDNVEPVLADWATTWQHLLELLFLQRQKDPRGVSVELFDFKKCVVRTKQKVLDKHVPCRVQLTKLNCRVQLHDVIHAIGAYFARVLTATKAPSKKAAPETSVYGIRIGRKSWTPTIEAPIVTRTVPKEVEAQIAEIRAVCDTVQAFLATCAVDSMMFDVEGKMTGTAAGSTRDAKLRVHMTDFCANGRGPIDFSTPLALLNAVGRLAVEASPATGAIDIELQTAGVAIARASLRDVHAQCDLDVARLVIDASAARVPLVVSTWGPQTATLVVHDALQAKVRVASTQVDAHLHGLLQAVVAIVQSQFRQAGVWPEKVTEYVLKYCSSDEFLTACSLRVAVDPRGGVAVSNVDDHPQPFLYFDHLQLVPLLLDIEAVVQFWIAGQLDAKPATEVK
ncbi:hypothetical protein ACHHYP_04810 [Achlya hypogyna]|uniref:Peroxin/Ferlin domain-containing protein n=1 Tax=Achlya hypogyna TaxID=1202772 RepID=A0A1V9YZR7_ACHHY|nr:hypothetical protein ACHHYP_04810 [Achlya hypogyna]